MHESWPNMGCFFYMVFLILIFYFFLSFTTYFIQKSYVIHSSGLIYFFKYNVHFSIFTFFPAFYAFFLKKYLKSIQ